MAPAATAIQDKRQTRTQQVMVGISLGTEIVPVGMLLVDRAMSGERDLSVGRFRYAPSYLKRPDAVALDPVHMPLGEGELRFATMGGLPSAIRDSAPDNWGRLLIRRYYSARGINAPLAEVDYLLASPTDRAGNLHFATDFGADGKPSWDKKALQPSRIPAVQELHSHVVSIVKDPSGEQQPQVLAEVEALLTGSGGARPKVNILGRHGTFLVKLAYPGVDRVSNACVEEASLNMARAVGINTAVAQARIAPGSDFLIVRRFDRKDDGQRMQMVSAMTVLGASDEAFNFTNWSYPLLAVELDRWSADPAADKEQLFRCMVLHAMLSDGDDHPRNYSLIRDPGATPGSRQPGGSTLGQWRLAPLYDIVAGRGIGKQEHELAMRIGTNGTQISEENILSQCSAFGLSRERATEIMLAIQAKVLSEFPTLLRESKASEHDIELTMRGVTRLNDRRAPNAIQDLIAQMDAKRDGGRSASAAQKVASPASPRMR